MPERETVCEKCARNTVCKRFDCEISTGLVPELPERCAKKRELAAEYEQMLRERTISQLMKLRFAHERSQLNEQLKLTGDILRNIPVSREARYSSAVSSKTSANVSSAAGSKTSANVSSAAGSKADESSKPAESSSKAASSADNKDSESQTDTAAVSDNDSTISIIESYDEAEFASVPPIKLDEEVSTADSRGSFPKGAIVGIVVCLMIAAAGVAVIMAKRKG